MAYVLLYLSCMALGYFLGSRSRDRGDGIGKAINLIMLISVSILVFIMGIRMGSNEEIIQNLGSIGLQSLLFTIIVVAGGILSVTVTRKLLGIDKYGRLRGKAAEEKISGRQANGEVHGDTNRKASAEAQFLTEANSPAQTRSSDEAQSGAPAAAMTRLIVLFVTLGLLFGYFYIRTHISDVNGFNEKAGYIMTVGLCILMGSIGFDMGLAGTVAAQIKQIGFRVLAFPIAVIIGTGLFSALASLFLTDLTLRECLAIGYGFGWYTFAPVTISGAGHVIAGAVSFMHNVIRETCGIILIPVLAKKIGYIEVCTLPGVAAADIGMTLVEQSTREDIIIYSFAIGILESLLIPFLVTFTIGA